MFNIRSVLCIIAGLLPLSIILTAPFLTDFSLFSDYISKIGVGNLAVVFNSSLILSATLVMPFVLMTYKRYNYLIVLFLAACVSLALVGLFPLSSPLHTTVSVAFFLLAFATIFLAGTKMKSWKRAISIALAVLCFVGLIFFNPFIETLQVFAVGIWVAAVGVLSMKKGLWKS